MLQEVPRVAGGTTCCRYHVLQVPRVAGEAPQVCNQECSQANGCTSNCTNPLPTCPQKAPNRGPHRTPTAALSRARLGSGLLVCGPHMPPVCILASFFVATTSCGLSLCFSWASCSRFHLSCSTHQGQPQHPNPNPNPNPNPPPNPIRVSLRMPSLPSELHCAQARGHRGGIEGA